jgi:cytochrome c oxidase accessory protein FixG
MTGERRLPVLREASSSLAHDGHRNFVHPADVAGRLTTRRHVIFAVLIAVYVALPFVRIGGKPAVFLDVLHRRFHLFGQSFNATDFWLVFFLLSGIGFSLIVLTTLFGRVWCGYACPQTVFLEGVFRRIERVIEGPRNERMKRNKAPVTAGKLARKTLKHAVFAALCVLLGHVFLSYFVSLPSLASMVQESPAAHPEAFSWVLAFSLITYFDFAWFREQLCLIVCPYGRLQSALTDRDTVVIGYDAKRGEPRGRDGAGDCVDCNRCVVVCPTGIDIRNGLQIDCIGCAACVDACDEVMRKVERPEGLVRYDSERGFSGAARKTARPRVFLYGALGLVGLLVASLAIAARTPLEAHLLRSGGSGFLVLGDEILNPMRLQIVNKSGEPMRVDIRAPGERGLRIEPSRTTITLREGESRSVSMVARIARAEVEPGLSARVSLRTQDGVLTTLALPVVGPSAP